MSEDANDVIKAFASAESGRAFFFGGISPLRTRSCTRTQVEKFVEFAGSNLSAVKSSPPFLVSASWHSTQYCSTNCRLARGKSRAIAGAATAKSRLNRRNAFMPWQRRTFTGLSPFKTRPGAKSTQGYDPRCRRVHL